MPIAPKSILLTRGQITWVDAEDFERLNQYRWHAQKTRRGFVPVSRVGIMPRFILGVADN